MTFILCSASHHGQRYMREEGAAAGGTLPPYEMDVYNQVRQVTH